MLIDQNNSRRFVAPDGLTVLAIFDQCRSYTTYAPVSADQFGRPIFVASEARTYWTDEVREINSGGHF